MLECRSVEVSPRHPRMRGQTKNNTAQPLPRKRATYIDELMIISLLQIVEYGGIVEVCQVGHILGLLVLGRVHLGHLLLLEGFLLRGETAQLAK